MKKKILSLLLAVSLLLSLCSPAAMAASSVTIVIDLTNYAGEVSGKLIGKPIEAQKRNEIVISGTGYVLATTISLGEDITCSWNVEGLDSGYLTYDENSHLSAIKLSPSGKKNVITVVDSKLEVTRTSRSTLMGSRGWNGATVVLTPVFEKGEYSATVNVKDAGKGTAGAFSIGGETYRLAAMGADGYAFDYWLAGESSSPIYENPYTVTLTENTNFTAYFRERRVPTVNAETNGTAAFTYENSSGGADQYTLTATPDELYVFDYWSWEGVPTGAENSAPEEQALPDEDMPEDGGEAEPPAESPEPAPSEPETTAPPEEAADGTETPPDETGAPTEEPAPAEPAPDGAEDATGAEAAAPSPAALLRLNAEETPDVEETPGVEETPNVEETPGVEESPAPVENNGLQTINLEELTRDWDETANPMTVALAEGMESVTFTAHFKLAEVTLGEGAYLKGSGSSGITVNPSFAEKEGDTLPAGSRAQLYLPLSVPSKIPDGQLTVTLYGGSLAEGAPLSSNVITQDWEAGKTYCIWLPIDPLPYTDKLTVTASVRTNAGTTETVEKTYEISTEANEANSAFTYVTSPNVPAGTEGSTTEAGPDIRGVSGWTDPETGEAELYFYGKDGVYTWADSGDRDLMSISDGLPAAEGDAAGVLAVGPDGQGGLLAAVSEVGKEIDKVTSPGYVSAPEGTQVRGGHFLYRYNGTSWSQVEDSCFSDYQKNSSGPDYSIPRLYNEALVILSDGTVWQYRGHWDGMQWIENDVEFNSFYRVSDTEIYAGSDEGLYQYNGTAWSKVETAGISGSLEVASGNADGKLLLMAGKNNYDPYLWDGSSATKLSLEGLHLNNANSAQSRFFGLDQDGIPYALVNGSGEGRNYLAVNGYDGSYVYKWDGKKWVYQVMADFNDPNEDPNDLSKKIRPDGVTALSGVIDGVSAMYGEDGAGAIYLSVDDATITFDAQGGTFKDDSLKTMTAPILSEVDSSKVPSVAKSGNAFGGWYYDAACTEGKKWDANTARMPGKGIMLYAKWTERTGPVAPDDPEMQYHRESALDNLEKAFNKYKKSDYSEANWKKLVAAYEQGIADINAALPAEDFIENNIIAALNKALAAMQAIPADHAGRIEVAVSMDANTLSLGYLIKPTLVTVDDRTPASVVITDLLSENGYDWENTGSITNSFYLAGVKPVNQTKAKIPQYILDHAGSVNMGDSSDKTLSEFDYHNMSGWMYSVDNDFPGVGASNWQMSDGEVMRWQFTVWGYGADLNADNTAWGSSSIVNVGDKGSLTWAVAELRSEYDDEVLEANEVYMDAMEVLTDPEASQSKINSAKTALAKEDFDKQPEKPDVPTVDVKPGANVDKDGNAKVELTEKEIETMIKNAVEGEAEIIAISPEMDSEATSLEVTFPKGAVDAILEETKASVSIQSDLGRVLLSRDVLTSISKTTEGGAVTVTVAVGKAENAGGLLKGQKDVTEEALKDCSVTEVTIRSGKEKVTAFGGKSITLYLPVENKAFEVGKSYVVYQISDDGSVEQLVGKCVKTGGKRFLEVATTHLSTFVALPVEVVDMPFTDVKEEDWFYGAVVYAYQNGILTGTGETTFSPNGTMTRSMLVTALWRLEGEPEASGASGFPDVKPDAWYAEAVDWASQTGLVSGTGAGFDPEGSVTREQIASILYRYAKLKGWDVSKTASLQDFADGADTSAWATRAMEWAYAEKLITGKDGNRLDPQGQATRAEVAAILMRLLESKAEKA